MNLIFDTETTGFTHPNKPMDHPDQPHLVQLAWILASDDERVIRQQSAIIRCPIEIPERATEVHGITKEDTDKFGVSLNSALLQFYEAVQMANRMVAHNIKFDAGVMDTAFSRDKTENPFGDRPLFCTMQEATPFAKIPPTEKMMASGRKTFKTPNLAEALEALTGETLTGGHDAMNDATACMKVYFAVRKRMASNA